MGLGSDVQLIRERSTGPTYRPFFRYMDTVGDGTGVKNQVADCSAVSCVPVVNPIAGDIMRVEYLHVFIEGAGAIATGGYGDLAALTNGIIIGTFSAGFVLQDTYTDAVNILRNIDYVRNGFTINNDPAGNTNVISFTLDLRSQFVRIEGGSAYAAAFGATLDDDFSSLTSHYFMVQGYYEIF